VPAEALSVLVVHESPAILEFIARLLQLDGIRALLARNSQEALEIAARSYVPIDLILISPASPKQSGASLADQVAQLRPDIRAVYLTARDEDSVIQLKLLQREGDWHSLLSPGKSLAEVLRAAARAPKARHGGGSGSSERSSD